MRPLIPAISILCLTLCACTQIPELEAEGLDAAENAPYPELIPLGPALAAADTDPRFSARDAEALLARAATIGTVASPGAAVSQSRADRLRARAAILRGPLETEEQIEAMRRTLAGL